MNGNIELLADDLLTGAGQIGTYLYGEDNQRNRRRVYRLATEIAVEDRPPIFRMGDGILRARPSKLLKWVEEKERLATLAPTAA
jgi:hypothetical protein